jgi:hypothetical protein
VCVKGTRRTRCLRRENRCDLLNRAAEARAGSA